MNFTPPPVEKIRYLLDDPGKGKFFKAFGFTHQEWPKLKQAILNMAMQNQHALGWRRTTTYGDEYHLTGEIETPIGRRANITTGWWMDPGQTNTLRFVTAYPNNRPMKG